MVDPLSVSGLVWSALCITPCNWNMFTWGGVSIELFPPQGNFGDAASYLVEKGADANDVYVDERGDRHSLLMDAIIVENVPFAELLVKHGANVNVTDEQGVTTLIQVLFCSFRNVVL